MEYSQFAIARHANGPGVFVEPSHLSRDRILHMKGSYTTTSTRQFSIHLSCKSPLFTWVMRDNYNYVIFARRY